MNETTAKKTEIENDTLDQNPNQHIELLGQNPNQHSELLDSKRTQLTILQSRISTYASKVWQLPLTFLGIQALASASILSGSFGPFSKSALYTVFLAGIIVIWCMVGVAEGYIRGSRNMARLEEELGLQPSTDAKKVHFIPYFALVLLATSTSFFAAFFY